MELRPLALAPERLILLVRWKEIVPKLVEIIKEMLPEAEVYLVGSFARGNADAWSDVDILIVTEKKLNREERVNIRTRLWEETERRGIPWWFPWELHFATPEELRRYPERNKLFP